MKKLFLTIVIVLIMAVGIPAKEITLNFAWDCNITDDDMAGYTLYKRLAAQTYDYENPDQTIPCVITEGACQPCIGSIIWDAPDGVATVYHFVARAFDTENEFSEDSNEVSQTIDLRPMPMPINFVGVWNDANNTVDLTWEQEQPDRVKKWLLEYGETSGGPYPDTYEVINTGQTTYTASVPIVAPPNTVITKYFVLRSLAAFDIESEVTAEIAVVIDKNEPPSAVINLIITVTE